MDTPLKGRALHGLTIFDELTFRDGLHGMILTWVDVPCLVLEGWIVELTWLWRVHQLQFE